MRTFKESMYWIQVGIFLLVACVSVYALQTANATDRSTILFFDAVVFVFMALGSPTTIAVSIDENHLVISVRSFGIPVRAPRKILLTDIKATSLQSFGDPLKQSDLDLEKEHYYEDAYANSGLTMNTQFGNRFGLRWAKYILKIKTNDRKTTYIQANFVEELKKHLDDRLRG